MSTVVSLIGLDPSFQKMTHHFLAPWVTSAHLSWKKSEALWPFYIFPKIFLIISIWGFVIPRCRSLSVVGYQVASQVHRNDFSTPANTSRQNDVISMPLRHITSHRHWYNNVLTLCVCWEAVSQFNFCADFLWQWLKSSRQKQLDRFENDLAQMDLGWLFIKIV